MRKIGGLVGCCWRVGGRACVFLCLAQLPLSLSRTSLDAFRPRSTPYSESSNCSLRSARSGPSSKSAATTDGRDGGGGATGAAAGTAFGGRPAAALALADGWATATVTDRVLRRRGVSARVGKGARADAILEEGRRCSGVKSSRPGTARSLPSLFFLFGLSCSLSHAVRPLPLRPPGRRGPARRQGTRVWVWVWVWEWVANGETGRVRGAPMGVGARRPHRPPPCGGEWLGRQPVFWPPRARPGRGLDRRPPTPLHSAMPMRGCWMRGVRCESGCGAGSAPEQRGGASPLFFFFVFFAAPHTARNGAGGGALRRAPAATPPTGAGARGWQGRSCSCHAVRPRVPRLRKGAGRGWRGPGRSLGGSLRSPAPLFSHPLNPSSPTGHPPRPPRPRRHQGGRRLHCQRPGL